jgi:hypothetical protein
MKAELDAAGIAEDTVWELVNAKTDYPQAVPIMVDWLEHLDERVPAGEDRRAWRAALLRNLVTANAKGNRRAVDAVVRQFDITPPLTPLELEAAVWAFAKIAQPADFDRVAALIRDSPLPRMNWVLVQWLGKVKTPEAVELAVEQLADPRTRVQAMRTLVRQKAPGVRGEVARYLDDDEPVFRKEAERALAKLPE